MADKVQELRPRLFDAGDVSITTEAFQRIRDAGVEPQQLLERHMRGDWSGSPVKWIEKNHLRFRGVKDYPVMTVYQLHPSENRVSIGTEADFSKTSVRNWPDGDHRASLLPLRAMEAGYQVQKEAFEKGSLAKRLMERIRSGTEEPKGPTINQKTHRKDRDLPRSIDR